MNRKNRIAITIMGMLGLMAMVLGIFISQHRQHGSEQRLFQGTLLDIPRPIRPFELIGIDKQPFNKASLKGHWTFMFFGFTNCGSICPTTMAKLNKMYHLVEKKGLPLPMVVMISVDPMRDTLTQLKRYVHAFNPDFYGARGDEPVLKAMTDNIGVMYAKIDSTRSAHYDIEHTGTVMLFNPNGDLRAFFTMPHNAKELANDYALLIATEGIKQP